MARPPEFVLHFGGKHAVLINCEQTVPAFIGEDYSLTVTWLPMSYNQGPSKSLMTILRCQCRKEGNVLFNDALNTFYLRLYGVRHMVKDHSDSEKGNTLPPQATLSD